jgi:hypothetical protein
MMLLGIILNRRILMNESIMRAVGFDKEVELVKSGKCPFCKTEVNHDSFKDRQSAREYLISGLCQACQDKMFGVGK